MAGIFIALLSGTLMSIQGVFNTQVTKQTSPLGVYGLGAAVGSGSLRGGVASDGPGEYSGPGKRQPALYAVRRRDRRVYYRYGHSGDGKPGPARATLLIVIAQLAVSLSDEVLGLFGVEKQPLEWRRIAGLLVAVGGIILFKWE